MFDEKVVSSFGESLRGELISPEDSGYETARALYNGMIDKRPRLIARCADVADVIQAVNFGRDNGLVIAIRGGGYNGPGFGSVDDGLVINLSAMKSVRVDPEARTARVGPGCTQGDVDHATQTFGLAVPAGIISTTGIAGLTLGGGHGYLSRKHGLTIDNLVEADVVLADGSFVTASAESHPDLFWALRGGGGNFGVVTSFLFRLHPVDTVFAGPVAYDMAHGAEIMRRYRDFLPRAPEELCVFLGLKTVLSSAPFPEEHWGKRMCLLMTCHAGDEAEGRAALAPLIEGLPEPLFDWRGTMPYPAVQRWGGCRSLPNGVAMRQACDAEVTRGTRGASMKEVTIIGIDLAKNVFQLHGAAADGTVLFRKKLSRPQFQRFMSEHPRCVVAMEACGGAHHWAREMERVGHEVRLIAPRYVKPFIKRQKNDAADAEAIAEAALRPTMRYVVPKTGEQQARAIVFRTREQFVNQRTEAINALRSHLYEFGYVAPQGIGYLPRLEAVIEDPSSDLPRLAREICRELLDQIAHLTTRINAMKKRIDAISRECETSRRLQTMPGVGPISALAVETFAPPMEQFKRGRDFAAWLGLVPRQASTGGKQRLGKTSKTGQRDIRRLLITGAMAVVRWALRHGGPRIPWLARMLERKPPMVAAFALANKMARGIWAMLTRNEDYRDPAIGSAA